MLERRVLDRPLASVSVVDMREEYAAEGPDVILSRALREGIQTRLDRREQALVLLNRRGFATAVFCRQCAGTIDCPNCSVSLVVHGEGNARRARCHYCNYTSRVPPACPLCAGPYLEQAGFGTERVEAEVKIACPEARVARLDRDSIRKKGALAALLSRFRDGAIDVLVGTQMIAKGHDFPRVTLVGVVSADVGLGLADFRAAERTFQLLTQVAGRAGRGTALGEAIVQTLYPDHYSIQLACRQDFPAFYDRELKFRTRDALSAGDLAGQRRRPLAHLQRRDGRCRGHRREGASSGSGTADSRTGAGPARQAARRIPGAAADQGDEPEEDSRSAAGARWPRGPNCSAASSSTSIRSACSNGRPVPSAGSVPA